jgi:hypothetical protein
VSSEIRTRVINRLESEIVFIDTPFFNYTAFIKPKFTKIIME